MCFEFIRIHKYPYFHFKIRFRPDYNKIIIPIFYILTDRLKVITAYIIAVLFSHRYDDIVLCNDDAHVSVYAKPGREEEKASSGYDPGTGVRILVETFHACGRWSFQKNRTVWKRLWRITKKYKRLYIAFGDTGHTNRPWRNRDLFSRLWTSNVVSTRFIPFGHCLLSRRGVNCNTTLNVVIRSMQYKLCNYAERMEKEKKYIEFQEEKGTTTRSHHRIVGIDYWRKVSATGIGTACAGGQYNVPDLWTFV